MGRVPPNVLKLRKQKRQGRRAYLTSVFSVIHVPRSVGKAHIPEDAKAVFDYRSRGIQDPEKEAYLNRIFPGVPARASEWKSESLSKYIDKDGNPIPENVGEVNGRRYCLNAAEEQRLLNVISDPDVCDYFTIHRSEMNRSRMTFVFNRLKTRCYFIEVFYRDNGCSYLMKSTVYGSESRALAAFASKRISWMEHLPLSSLELVLPRRGS